MKSNQSKKEKGKGKEKGENGDGQPILTTLTGAIPEKRPTTSKTDGSVIEIDQTSRESEMDNGTTIVANLSVSSSTRKRSPLSNSDQSEIEGVKISAVDNLELPNAAIRQIEGLPSRSWKDLTEVELLKDLERTGFFFGCERHIQIEKKIRRRWTSETNNARDNFAT